LLQGKECHKEENEDYKALPSACGKLMGPKESQAQIGKDPPEAKDQQKI